MILNRREYLAGSAAMAASLHGTVAAMPAVLAPAPVLPARHDFAATDIAYLDNGSQHPVSLGARAAIDRYLQKRMLVPGSESHTIDDEALLAKFARLVGADPAEVTFVQSTTTGEQMVLRALGLPQAGGHIVTDTLHFFGSIPLYEEMARQGCEVTWLRPVDGRIRIEDIRRAVGKGTRLVALSLVSTVNGFEHDLKAVCDIAHAAGALVYADIIHAAGCVPVDLHASGVDFAACASYKWLMGDFGLGFLYVRKDLLPTLKRANYGYYGISQFATHIYPLDPPGSTVADYAFRPDATGAFALGTHSHMVAAQLDHSLEYIAGIGVPEIQRHAQRLVDILKREVPKRGYAMLTPPEARTPLVTFVAANARDRLGEPMKAAKVTLTMSRNRFRLTPSVQNTEADIERFLSALPRAE